MSGAWVVRICAIALGAWCSLTALWALSCLIFAALLIDALVQLAREVTR